MRWTKGHFLAGPCCRDQPAEEELVVIRQITSTAVHPERIFSSARFLVYPSSASCCPCVYICDRETCKRNHPYVCMAWGHHIVLCSLHSERLQR